MRVCVFALLQLCITTWKLFEALLCKHDRHVAHNLVLRNLAAHAHIEPSPASLRVTSVAETNCVDGVKRTVDKEKLADFGNVTSLSSLPAPQTLMCEDADILASGDGGFSRNSNNSQSSPSVPNTVVDTPENGVSEVNAISSLCRNGRSTPSAEAETHCLSNAVAGGDTHYGHHVAGVDIGVHSHEAAEHRSESENQTAASLLPSLPSSSSQSSTEIPIQQVVYT